MGHSAELLARVASEVSRNWPMASVVLEKPLALTNRRMQPDVQLIENGRVVCVVEIGYTRPEKLTEYRRLGIPDVRWYDKSCRLHHVEMKKAATESIERSVAYRQHPESEWRFVGEFSLETCWALLEQACQLLDFLEAAETKPGRLRCIGRWLADTECGDHELREFRSELIALAGADSKSERSEIMFESILDVMPYQAAQTLFFNGYEKFGLVYCDMCGDESIDYDPIAWDGPEAFYRAWTKDVRACCGRREHHAIPEFRIRDVAADLDFGRFDK